jgi:hypothetical protein
MELSGKIRVRSVIPHVLVCVCIYLKLPSLLEVLTYRVPTLCGILAADVTALSHFAGRPQEGCVISVFISYLTNCTLVVKFLSIKCFF